MQESSARQRLLREARSAATLNHTNICTIHEIGEVQENEDLKFQEGERVPSGTPFIAMELIEGNTLEKLVAGGSRDYSPFRRRLQSNSSRISCCLVTARSRVPVPVSV